ncbi:hypothetical protein JCM15765_02830 [Paradesulfitobacterium aromaticivorans]
MGLPSINLVSPANQASLSVTMSAFDATYSDNTNQLVASSVKFEIDTVSTFDSSDKITSEYVNVKHNTTCRMAAILSNGTWYWRVTATNASGTTVSQTQTLTVSQVLKRTFSFYENIAKLDVWTNKRIIAFYENVAKLNLWSKKRTQAFYENVAKANIWTDQRALYEYENITSDPPFPFIERLSTTRASEGSVVTIYGNGFGAKAEADTLNADRAARGYGGFVYLGNQLCNVISWSWDKIVFQIPQEAESGAVKVALTVPDPPGLRYSNVIGMEVYDAEPADDIGIELFVCDKNNPNSILCQLDGVKNKSFQVLLNNPGSGKFSISRYDEKGGSRDYVTDQNFILCRLDGIDIFKWIIEARRPSYVDEGEQQMIEVSGRGVLSLLDRAVVYPEGMPHPATLDRTFKDAHGGAILRQLLLEAQQRGCLVGVSIDWTADADTLGNPFEDSTTISFHSGTPLSQVATKLSEGMGLFDIEMTPTLHLKLYKVKGTDKYDTVKYRPGQAIIKHQNQSDSSNMTNALLVEGESGSLIETAHPTSQMDWGRREGYLQARNIPSDWAKLQDYGQLFLRGSAQVSWGIQGTVIKFIDSEGNKLKPFETFMMGDWIGWYIPPEGSDTEGFDGKVRVKGITCEEDDAGALSYVLELNNIMLEHEIRMNQLVERMSMFTQNSSLSTPATESPSGISHNHTHSMLLGLNSDDHPQYYNEERHAADLHTGIARVAGIKKAGSNEMTGVITLSAGSNISIAQDDVNKTFTIAASATVASNQWFHFWTGNPTKTTTTQMTKGAYLAPEADIIVKGISAVLDDTGRDIKLAIYELSSANVQIGNAMAESSNITMTGKKNYVYKLSDPVTLKAGHFYALVAVLQSGTTLGACSSTYTKDTFLSGVNGYLRLAGIPANGATWEVLIGTSPYAFGMLIEV